MSFFRVVAVWPFDEAAAKIAAYVTGDLSVRGVKIGPMDTLIAGTALAHKATLVTNNTGEFSRVRGLNIEDWSWFLTLAALSRKIAIWVHFREALETTCRRHLGFGFQPVFQVGEIFGRGRIAGGGGLRILGVRELFVENHPFDLLG
jgi:hypothetical protein